jgi:hypothetical protein
VEPSDIRLVCVKVVGDNTWWCGECERTAKPSR